ncbi:MAG: GWxTD domain-containing protein [Ignavibacteriales bacterium]|nr:GWxTD domain-containing protein [Ignavibacteriales bacterium]
MMKTVSVVSILLFSASVSLFGQPMRGAPMGSVEKNHGGPIESAIFFTDSNRAVVNLHYRIPKNFFVFVRSNDLFRARGELLVELLNDKGYSASRSIKPIELTRASAREESLSDLQDAISFLLESGSYRIQFEVKDLESGKTMVERNQTLQVRMPASDSLALSPPIMIEFDSPTVPSDSFRVANLGGAAMVGSYGALLFQVAHLPLGMPVVVDWNINRREDDDHLLLHLQGSRCVLIHGYPEIQVGSQLRYRIRPGKEQSILIPLPVEKLEEGTYRLHLTLECSGQTIRREYPIRVLWPNRPASLSNLNLAIESLHHIATEEEIDELSSFSTSRREEGLKKFWRKRSPDTTLVYNPVMAEYYRRVDEAIRRFSTQSENDGYKTDRGRILILFGAPARTDRVFRPSTYATEVWLYPALKKKFIFTDPNRTGNYILAETENL